MGLLFKVVSAVAVDAYNLLLTSVVIVVAVAVAF